MPDKKFIPNGDTDFVVKAECFANAITKDPVRFGISAGDAEQLGVAVKAFRAAMRAASGSGRSAVTTAAKNAAREQAELIMRRLGHLIRSNLNLSDETKIIAGIQPRKAKPTVVPCPQEPPRLKFVRALHEGNGATPMHELQFFALDHRKARPDGAARLELFVDLVPPEEPIPTHPGANTASRPWYLRSYTKSPIVLTPPMARVPMRVVYWARWADTGGEVGPFSATCVGWIEGGTHWNLPGGIGMPVFGGLDRREQVRVFEEAPLPAERDEKYRVAVLEVQFHGLAARQVPVLESDERPTRQLEGPAVEAA